MYFQARNGHEMGTDLFSGRVHNTGYPRLGGGTQAITRDAIPVNPETLVRLKGAR